jgi:hypothetical protein
MDPLLAGVLISVAFSLLLALIEIPHSSRASIGSSITGYFVLYVLVLILGNTGTTLLASGVLPEDLPGPRYFWYAFVGVFGFQIVLKNVNLTVFDKGVLTVEDWITKARDRAVAAAVKCQAVRANREAADIAEKLCAHPALNTYVTHHLGNGAVAQLEKAAKENAADSGLIKALALASQKPDVAAALARKLPATRGEPPPGAVS